MKTETMLPMQGTGWRSWQGKQGMTLRLRQWWGALAARRADRRLRLRETLPLGDRRFVALVEINGQEFLLGCTQSSVSLLKEFPSANGAEVGVADSQ